MSELPGLPPAPRGDVALLMGGAASAQAKGRVRLLRAGLGGSVALAVVAAGVVVVLSGPSADPSDALIADDAPSATPTSSTAPQRLTGGGPTPHSVDLCLGDDCRTLADSDQAGWLRDALSTAQPAEPGQGYCRAEGPEYLLRFRHPSVRSIGITVRSVCGPTSSGDRDFVLDPLVIARVVRAYDTGTVDPPAFPRGASALSLCDDADVSACQRPRPQTDIDRLAVLLSAGGLQREPDACGEIGQPTVKIAAGYVRGSAGDVIVRATAGTVCGPLETSDGRRFALTEQARQRLQAVLVPTEPPPTSGTASCTWRPPRASAGDRAGDVTEPAGNAPRIDRSITLKTNRGDIGLRLLGTRAPCTVHNLVHLATEGYYDGTRCHRVTTKGIFVVQCGDPTGNGSGNPGYEFDDEALEGSTYPRGTLAMANAGEGTNGSQFFMVWKDSELPPLYTVFGRVDAAGLAVLDEVAAGGATKADDGPPALELTISGVTLS